MPMVTLNTREEHTFRAKVSMRSTENKQNAPVLAPSRSDPPLQLKTGGEAEK